ncbi:MAG: M20/M25/M40 family metallo-hydrolase [Desulfurococcaceae archaeon]
MRNALIKNLAVEMLLDLLKTYSPPRGERQAVEILGKYAEKLGYEHVEVDEVGNLIASYGKGDRTLALIGHIDTIPWKIPISVSGDEIQGRGAVDAKGPLVAGFIGFALAKDFVNTGKYKIYAIALVDEEGESIGAKHLVRKGFRAKGVVIAEPTNTNGVVIGYRGSLKVRVYCTGQGGHSSMGSSGSACEKLIGIWNVLKNRGYDNVGVNHNTAVLLKLECGEDMPVIPREGSALIQVRIGIDNDPESVIHDIRNAISSMDGCEWDLIEFTKPVKSSINNEVARALIRALLRAGQKPRVLYKHGTSDMNILFPVITEDMIAYGPGRSELAHSAEERISMDELKKGIEIYRRLVEEWCVLNEG